MKGTLPEVGERTELPVQQESGQCDLTKSVSLVGLVLACTPSGGEAFEPRPSPSTLICANNLTLECTGRMSVDGDADSIADNGSTITAKTRRPPPDSRDPGGRAGC